MVQLLFTLASFTKLEHDQLAGDREDLSGFLKCKHLQQLEASSQAAAGILPGEAVRADQQREPQGSLVEVAQPVAVQDVWLCD